MAQAIVIIGGLEDDADRNALLDLLREESGPAIEWDWIKAAQENGYNVDFKALKHLLARLANNSNPAERPRVVMLYRLHGRVASSLHRACQEPVLAPKWISSEREFVEWLFSAEANLIPRREWYANRAEAAIIAILCKLLKNKSWNKDSRGHAWTKEEDLLRQAPVDRREFPEVAVEAAKMLPALKDRLLLSKGGTQGKTPKEWSIHLSALKHVKHSIVEQSLIPLSGLSRLTQIVRRARKDEEKLYRLDDEVVTERVRQICRDHRA